MSLISKSSKLLVPVKQCLSFAQDQLFESARKTLQEAGIKWTDIINGQTEKLNNGQLGIPAMDSVFFHQDRFEVLIDARGYRPEDLRCTITPNVVEVVAQRQERINSSNRTMSLTRSYQLPQNVKPEEGNCCMSTEGVLLVTAPWAK